MPSIFLVDWQVRALQEGRLKQIRVPVRPQPTWMKGENLTSEGWEWQWNTRNNPKLRAWPDSDKFAKALAKHSPFQPGDVLAVKETWCQQMGGYIYKATDEAKKFKIMRWRSPVTMPLSAVRYWLTVGEDVRAQRASEATEEDARAEGVRMPPFDDILDCGGWRMVDNWWKDEYKNLWTARYGKRYPFETAWTFVAGARVEK